MSDTVIQKQCEELVNKILGLTHRTPEQQEARVTLLMALYVDGQRAGMEKAAKIADKKAEEPWKNAAVKCEGRSIAYAIRQAATEPSREALLRLRDESGYGIRDCQNAMQHSGDDYEKAKTFLREKRVGSG